MIGGWSGQDGKLGETYWEYWEYNNTWILMAEKLNMHFGSVFTRKYTSSLPVQETKLDGPEGECWSR